MAVTSLTPPGGVCVCYLQLAKSYLWKRLYACRSVLRLAQFLLYRGVKESRIGLGSAGRLSFHRPAWYEANSSDLASSRSDP